MSLALGASVALAACGFSPVYAPGNAGERLREQVRPRAPGSRNGFIFATRVEDRLGRAGDSAPFVLDYRLRLNDRVIALTGGGGAERIAIEGVAEFSLRRAGGDTVLTSGTVDAFASFTDVGTSVATRTARRDAQSRVVTMLADAVVDRLAATAGDWLP